MPASREPRAEITTVPAHEKSESSTFTGEAGGSIAAFVLFSEGNKPKTPTNKNRRGVYKKGGGGVAFISFCGARI